MMPLGAFDTKVKLMNFDTLKGFAVKFMMYTSSGFPGRMSISFARSWSIGAQLHSGASQSS